MARCCPGVRARWTAGSLAGAFLDLALVYAFLCAASVATAASRLLALFGLSLPCTCARPHLPCLLVFLSRYPFQVIDTLLLSLRSRFPFRANAASRHQDQEQDYIGFEDGEGGDEAHMMRQIDNQRDPRAGLLRELEKERSAAASAAEEAMAMILRLQKEKAALEIELRQRRRTSDERCAFYEDEVEELRDILLMREREARCQQKEVEGYRRLLGLPAEDEEEEEEMVTPRNGFLEGEPSSSKSADNNDAMLGSPLGEDSIFTFRTPFLSGELVSPVNHADKVKGASEDGLAVKTRGKLPLIGSRLDMDSCEDDVDCAETVVILPLSARSLDLPLSARSFDQGGVDAAAGLETVQEMTADEFQEVECGGVDKICHDLVGSENDANIYDVHVVDDLCFSTEGKGVFSRSFSDATMQVEKLQNRVTADDLLRKSLNAIKRAQDKIRHAATERRESLQLQLLEDIANQLQEIKDTAAVRNLHCTSPIKSKKI